VELLLVVANQPGIGVAAAARALHLVENSVSTLVNQLMAAGLLTRERNAADQRAVHLTLTEAARKRIAMWRGQRARLVAGALAGLPDWDSKALQAAMPAFRNLLTALEEEA
jgi:DNA-binding MarR family transcriptional regulator